MEIGLVRKIDIDQEMQQAYLDYAMSVIVSRALPDARDGLKPVHRRILYAMFDMGLRPDSPYKKSARVVGEVLGKYHPHSDQAVYDAMARMVQDFSMRYPLVDGQGNFGSVDGDPPAAMRYTEARLATPAMDMLSDIQRDTVDYDSNFDDTLREPLVLPAALPNLLINGATGIAVGMSTSVPPHNLGEVVDALVYILENWKKMDDISIEELMGFIQGPDFPTGGVILGGLHEEGLQKAYGWGGGRNTVPARAHVEELGRGRQRIIVTELPYMTNKAALIERIAELARGGSLEGISDLRDESDRQGMRIVIELGKNADADKVLAALYRRTAMQGTFSIILLALVNGEPRLLSLKQALRVYLDHRLEVVRRRSRYELERAQQRSHILEGLRVALQNLDEVIKLIRNSADVDKARARLMSRFELSEAQAQAILDMPLRRLAALERKKIELEYKEVQKLIKDLETLLKSPVKMRKVVADELTAVKDAYGDRRRTQIVHMEEGASMTSMLTASELEPDKAVWVGINGKGQISRSHEDKPPRPSGGDAPRWLLHASTRDTLYLVAEDGMAAALAVHSLPEAEKLSDGLPVNQTTALKTKTNLAAAFALPPKETRPSDWYLLTLTREGMIKKSSIDELPGPISQTFRIANLKKGERLGWAEVTDGRSEIILVSAAGMAIRFKEDDVRPMGLAAAGVNAMKLKGDDEIVGLHVVDPKGEVFLLASDGNAKRVQLSQFPAQGRYGQGVLAWKLTDDIRLVGSALDKPNQRVTIHLDKLAPKSARLDDAPVRTRPSGGKPLFDLRPGDRIIALTAPWEAHPDLAKAASRPKPASKSPAKQKPAPKKPAKPKPAPKKPAKKAAAKKKSPPKKK